MHKFLTLLRQLGPGILFASTCIGVSHLVQSTRAGALYGFELAIFVLLANIFKYPFFEFGTRYAAATGKSILVGYYREARWMLVLYLVVIMSAVLTVTAGVTMVTAGMLGNLLSINLSVPVLSIIVMGLCFIILFKGSYGQLELTIKIIASFLVISTISSFLLTILNVKAPAVTLFNLDLLFANKSLIFIVALMGWMPSALDMSSWNSIWTVEKMKIEKSATFKIHLTDFNIGYLITSLLAFCFLGMGALLLYEKGLPLSNSSVEFASQLTGMFTTAIGDWVFVVIAISAFSTMFSTSITVLDGYPRIIEETVNLLLKKELKFYRWILAVIMLLSLMIIIYFANNLAALIDLAAAISFVSAPIIAVFNYRVVTGKQIEKRFQPKTWLRVLSYLGIAFLLSFSIIYLLSVIQNS